MNFTTEQIEYMASMNVAGSKQQVRKDMAKLQKIAQDIQKSNGGIKLDVSIDNNEFAKINKAVKENLKTLGLSNAEISKTTAKVSSENKNLINVQMQLTNAIGDTSTVMGKYDRMANTLSGNLNEVKTVTTMTETKFEAYQKQLDAVIFSSEKLNVVAKQYGNSEQHNQIDGLNEKIKKSSININQTEKEIKDVISQTKKWNQEMQITSAKAKAQGKASLSMGNQIKNAMKGFSIWSAVTVVWYKAIQIMGDMVKEVKALDDSLLELSKVTNLSSSQLDDFADKAEIAGKKVNASASQIIQASADFARMGFSSNVSMGLAEDAIVLTKIADGITDVSEASTAMIAILKGFNMEASQSRMIIDSINEVSNNFAINTDDLADGLRRIGGTMAQSNTTFQETIGLLTAGQESLQSIEKVSSGLITISTRLRAVTEDGEALDGLMPKLEASFAKYAKGVKISTPDGQLRSTYEILVDLSKVWGDMDSKARSEVGFLVAGTRQAPVLNAIMTNLNTTLGATESAYESSGSAQKEFDKVSESLQGRLDALKSSFSSLANDTLSSEFLKVMVDALRITIEFIDAIGIFNIAIIALSGVISAKFLRTIVNATGITNTFKVAIAGAKTASLALYGVMAGVGIVAILAITNGIIKQVNATKDAKVAFDEAKIAINSLSDSSTKIDILTASIEKMKNAVEYDEITRRIEVLKDAISNAGDGDIRVTYWEKTLASLEEKIKNITTAQGYLKKANEDLKWEKYYSYLEQTSKTTKKVVDETYSLEEAMYSLNQEGADSEETLNMLINSHEFMQIAISGTKDEISNLAKKWGISEEDISNAVINSTNLLITETATKIATLNLLKSEIRSVAEEQEKTNTALGLGNKNKLAEILGEPTNGMFISKETEVDVKLKTTLALLEKLKNRQKDIGDMFSDSDKKKEETKELEEYYNQLSDYQKMIHDLAILEGKASTETNQRYDERLEIIEDIKTELNRLNNEDRDRLATLNAGTEEYDSLLSTINSRSEEWFNWTKKSMDIEQERLDLLESIGDAQNDILGLIMSALEDEAKAKEEMFKDTIESIEDEISAVEDAEKEKLKIRYEAQKEGYTRQKELLQKQLEEFNYLEEKADKEKEILDIKTKLKLALTEKERYDLNAQLSELQKDLSKTEMEYLVNKKVEELDAKIDLAEVRYDADVYYLEQGLNAEVEATKIRIKLNNEIVTTTVANARTILANTQTTLAYMESETRNWASEAQNIFENGGNAVYDFLSSNLEDFAKYTEAMIADLNAKLALAGSTKKTSTIIAEANTGGFGTTKTATSEAYYSALKSDYGSQKEMLDAELKRTEDVIEAKKSAGEDTTMQEIWKNKIQQPGFTFDSGGEAYGKGFLHKDTIEPERVLSPKQTADFSRLVNITPSLLNAIPQLLNQRNISSSGVEVNVILKDANIGSKEEMNKTLNVLGNKISLLKEVRGLGTSIVGNSRK